MVTAIISIVIIAIILIVILAIMLIVIIAVIVIVILAITLLVIMQHQSGGRVVGTMVTAARHACTPRGDLNSVRKRRPTNPCARSAAHEQTNILTPTFQPLLSAVRICCQLLASGSPASAIVIAIAIAIIMAIVIVIAITIAITIAMYYNSYYSHAVTNPSRATHCSRAAVLLPNTARAIHK